MKRLVLSLAAATLCITASAQQFIIVNDGMPILASDVDKITYEVDDQFDSYLLAGRLQTDQKISLFTEALKLTGLIDTLRNYVYEDYVAPNYTYYYRSYNTDEVAYCNLNRLRKYTVFVETDDVFAANGITTLEQLKAYAKKIYDVTFPEDAGVSDLKDRRNSLNRFVAYHILKHGSTYNYLTALDKESGVSMRLCIDEELTEMSAWYGTLMPQGALKCSHPARIGANNGVYLNRRGLGRGADKYGKQVRGVKVVAVDGSGFDHESTNGNYMYIDSILTYDQTTRDEVLGSELWRVDFKTLSPDIMNNAPDLRGKYLEYGSSTSYGRNYYYKWDSMENISGDMNKGSVGLIARRAHSDFWSWQGDEMNAIGDFDMTIKLPPLPAGEWEVRMGACAMSTRGDVRVYINGEVVIDTLEMRNAFYYSFRDDNNLTLNYMWEHPYFKVENLEDPKVFNDNEYRYLVTDLQTNEQICTTRDLMSLLSTPNIAAFYGVDPTTGVQLDWNERATNYRKQAEKAANLAKYHTMQAPRECMLFRTGGAQTSFADIYQLARIPLGRFTSDGKKDNYLRIEGLPNKTNATETVFDYFEFVPKAVYDNQDIPED